MAEKLIHTFPWKGKTCTVTVEHITAETVAKSYVDDELFGRYSVTFGTAASFRHVIGTDPVYGPDGLVACAERDIKEML